MAPRRPHTAALGDPSKRTGSDDRLRERWAWKGALTGTGRSLPGVANIVIRGNSYTVVDYFCLLRNHPPLCPGGTCDTPIADVAQSLVAVADTVVSKTLLHQYE